MIWVTEPGSESDRAITKHMKSILDLCRSIGLPEHCDIYMDGPFVVCQEGDIFIIRRQDEEYCNFGKAPVTDPKLREARANLTAKLLNNAIWIIERWAEQQALLTKLDIESLNYALNHPEAGKLRLDVHARVAAGR
jgi:hypothetical protein